MTEYMRTQNGVGERYQWVDAEWWLVLDLGCDPPRIQAGRHTREEALNYCRVFIGWETRFCVTRLDCIRGFKVE